MSKVNSFNVLCVLGDLDVVDVVDVEGGVNSDIRSNRSNDVKTIDQSSLCEGLHTVENRGKEKVLNKLIYSLREYYNVDPCFNFPNSPKLQDSENCDKLVYSDWNESNQSIAVGIIEKHQFVYIPIGVDNPKKWYACNIGKCCTYLDSCYHCDEKENIPDINTKAISRLMNLIKRKTDTTPVDELAIYYGFNFTNFFKYVKGQRCENFKQHNVVSNDLDRVCSLYTWLSFNTGEKRINKKTGLNENLKLFICTYDEVSSSHEYDKINEVNNYMSLLRRDLHVLRKKNDCQHVLELISITEKKMRIVYSNYLVILSRRFKFFRTFEDARKYINIHGSKIKISS